MSGETPQTRISINPTALQFWVWAAAKIVAIAIGVFFFAQWVAGYTFKQSLEEFHEEAVPEIQEMVDERIHVHQLEAQQKYHEDMSQIKETLVEIKVDLKYLKENR